MAFARRAAPWGEREHVSSRRRSSSESSGGSRRILDRYGVEWFLPATEWCDAAAGLSRTPTHMGKTSGVGDRALSALGPTRGARPPRMRGALGPRRDPTAPLRRA